MGQFRAHAGNYNAIFFQCILSYYTWSKEKNVFSTHLQKYLVHRLRTNLIFKQIPLHIRCMGFELHMFVNDTLPQM